MAAKMIAALKETLAAQQKLVHKLYTELEAEREASSTAASEALSMILRLQGEKAAEKLEASQFKRVIEEKMNLAQETMMVFEEIIHQKEMEIASLEFQVQAYRYKILSMGLTDSEIGEMGQNELHSGDVGPHVIVRRVQSLPAVPFKGSTLQTESEFVEDEDNEFEVYDKDVQKIYGKSPVRDLTSYWEQITELDERVEELSRAEVIEYDRVISNKGLRSTGYTYPEELRSGIRSSLGSALSDPTRGVRENKLDYQYTFSCSSSRAKDPENFLPLDHYSVSCAETESIGSASQSLSIYDVFEVPQNSDNNKPCPPQKLGGKKAVLEEENRLGKPDLIPHGTNKYCYRDQVGYEKSSLVDLTNGSSPFQNDFQQLNKRLEKIEDGRRIVKQEVSGCEEDNSRLLKEIQKQLNSIQSEIRTAKPKNDPVADEPTLVSQMEAMFFYSL